MENGLQLLNGTRLLTLTGAGGSGKTRLAIEIARRVATDLAWPVGWIELAEVTDPGLLADHIAATLGLRETQQRSALEAIIESVGDRPSLLVLDNCEHLIDVCAQLVEVLLRESPHLTMLTTSREAVGIVGERTWLVPLLPVPGARERVDVRQAGAIPSVQLFVDRARASVPGFELTETNVRTVAEICTRLDGIPLAIELAAARIRVLAPEQIADRLHAVLALAPTNARGTRARHRTLRGTIEWSYRLLTADEQRLFARLAVFVGSISLEAIEAVCTDEWLPADHAVDVLSTLVDKSLIACDLGETQARYRLLETIRQYANEQLSASGEVDEVRRRMAAYYMSLAAAVEPRLFGGASDARLQQQLEHEMPNFRAVEDWCRADVGRTVVALEIGTALHWHWFAQGRFQEGRSWLTAALSRTAEVPRVVRARALTALGYIAIWHGDAVGATPAFTESVSILRELSDSRNLIVALIGLASAALAENQLVEGGQLAREALALLGDDTSTVLTPLALYWDGMIATAAGDVPRARASLGRAAAIGRELGHRPAIAHPLYALGALDLRVGRTAEAIAALGESVAIHHANHDRWGVFQALASFAQVACDGEPDRSARLLGASEAIRAELGVEIPPPSRQAQHDLTMNLRAALGHDAFLAAWQAGQELTIAEAVAYALAPYAHSPTPEPRPRPNGRMKADLSVRALGTLEVERRGKRVSGRVWGSAKARELLVFVLCHPEGIGRERIGAALWPDASPSQLRNNFHVTLHRVRQALGGGDWIVVDGDRYAINPAFVIDFDAAAFEREARGLMSRLHVGSPLPSSADLVLDRYRGDFLEHENAGEWHQALRDDLLRLYLDLLLACGDALVSSRREPESITYYRRLIGRDPTNERAFRGLMHAHARLGDRAAVQRVYHELATTLRNELDAEPDPETLAAFRKLAAAHS